MLENRNGLFAQQFQSVQASWQDLAAGALHEPTDSTNQLTEPKSWFFFSVLSIRLFLFRLCIVGFFQQYVLFGQVFWLWNVQSCFYRGYDLIGQRRNGREQRFRRSKPTAPSASIGTFRWFLNYKANDTISVLRNCFDGIRCFLWVKVTVVKLGKPNEIQ